MGLSKCIVRYTVIAGLAGGAAVLVAGPERVGAILTQTRSNINSQLDKAIKDPVALRAQLRSLEAQYPQKIGEVRGDLAEVREQVAQITRDREVSTRVVELAHTDLTDLQPLITKAEMAISQGAGVYASTNAANYSMVPVVRISFGNESIDLKEAYNRAERTQQVIGVYSAKVTELDRDMGYLTQQEQRLSDLSTQLETEHAQFSSQLWALDRQIDSIGRNDRMIETMQKRQDSIDEHSRYRVNSLEQLTARFSEIRSKQEAQLASLGKAKETMNYENRAKIDLDARNTINPAVSGPSSFSPMNRLNRAPVIEIRPDSDAKASKTSAQTVSKRID